MKKVAKKILAYCITLAMMITLFPAVSAKAADSEEWIKIYTAEDLYNVRYDMSANYKLMNDIDLSTIADLDGDFSFMGNGWEPIGSNGEYSDGRFTGTFDGQGHAITGLIINFQNKPAGAGSVFLGLFSANCGTIKNFDLTYDIKSSVPARYVGGVAAYNHGTIENVHTSGHIECGGTYVGGITARNTAYYDGYKSTYINNCSNLADIKSTNTSSSYVGGIAGAQSSDYYYINSNAKMFVYARTNNCYNSGNVEGGRSAGITTKNDSVVTYIVDCYNAGNIKGTGNNSDFAAGIGEGEIKNCYNVGNVEVSYGTAYVISNYSASNSYYFPMEGTAVSGCKELTPKQMTIANSFVGFDFDEIWYIDENTAYPYPQLRSNPQDTQNVVDLVKLSSAPSKTEYFTEDEELDLTGGKIKVYKSDDTSEFMDIDKSMVSGYDLSTPGKQTVTVTYKGYTVSFDINVVDKGQPTGMKLVSGPNKKEFVRGTEFDFTGCKVLVTYEDEKFDELKDITADMTTGGNINKSGEYTVSYEYAGYSVSFDVEVVPVESIGIEVGEMPAETSVLQDGELDTTGLVINVLYNNGNKIPTTKYTLDYSTAIPGAQMVKVTFDDEPTYTTQFRISVKQKIHVSQITVSEESMELDEGETGKLEATVLPENASIKTINWVSEDDSVATVTQDGKIFAVSAGTVLIKAMASDDEVYGACEVTVNHILGDVVVTKEAGCYSKGELSAVCTMCGKAVTEEIPATGHIPEYVDEVPATCLSAGVTGGTQCSACGERLAGFLPVEAKGHKWDDGEIAKAVTCTEDGDKLYTCTGCGIKKHYVVDAVGHDPVTMKAIPATCTEDGQTTWTRCSACLETLFEPKPVPATGHMYDNGLVITEPSYTTKGLMKYSCKNCDESYTEEIPVLPLSVPVVKTSVSASGVKVTWDAVPGATGYYVYKAVGTGTMSLVDTISDGTATYMDTAAKTNGETYSYKVMAYNSEQQGEKSAVVTACFLTAPTLSSVVNATKGTTVKWTKNAAATGYYIYRSKDGGSYSKVKTITSPSTLSWNDTGATTNGSKYQYKIYAYKIVDGVSYTGAVSSVKTTYCMTRPTISSASNSASKKMTVKWAKNSKASGYQVKYVTGSTTKTVTITSGSTVSKVISSLTKGKTYKVYVRSYKTVSGTKYYSEWSAAKSVKISK